MLMTSGYMLYKRRKRWYNRRWWVRPINQDREQRGAYSNIFAAMRTMDEEEFFKYTRMSRRQFDTLVKLLTPLLKKRSQRKALSVGQRLAMTLKYLAHGGSTSALGWEYYVAKSTAQKVLKETCQAIWRALSPKYLKRPQEEDWRRIADGFHSKWNLPNCVGAIDGKHIAIQAPSNAGSLFFNYKKTHSIVLMAACDAEYNFTLIDIGAYGSQSDGGIFSRVIGRAVETGDIVFPPPEVIPGMAQEMPYYLVGDAAFPQRKWLMRPYPGRSLSLQKSIFNYRLSRGRRTIENAFGILASRWRILRSVMVAQPDTVEAYVSACVCLHNFIKSETCGSRFYCPPNYVDSENNGVVNEGNWRLEMAALRGVGRLGANIATRVAYELRDMLANYFITREGEVPWQYHKVTSIN
ncbi:protein ALP1-like [Ischnura elegans]|nr:protein ALP1-like [Ischnura elegans]